MVQTRMTPIAAALFLAATCLAATAVTAADRPAGIQVVETKEGQVLADAKGMTLYFFDRDTPGVSNCSGTCAQTWPPLTAADTAGAGAFTVITRADGNRQWAYKGRPLYGWSKDQKPGDITGHGFRDVWWVAKP